MSAVKRTAVQTALVGWVSSAGSATNDREAITWSTRAIVIARCPSATTGRTDGAVAPTGGG